VTATAPLLEIAGLRVGFPLGRTLAEAVRGVSLTVTPAEAVGLVGESGSGKSLTALAVMRLIDPPGQIVGGRIALDGRDLLALEERELRRVRGADISMIFQDPLTSLNPAFTIGRQLTDVIVTHQGVDRREARRRAVEVLATVGIPAPARRLGSYPHEFSGGMRQRVLIGMAVACRPRLLIADEPTTALDVTIQAQVIALIRRLREELGLAVLFITHNLDLVAEFCDRVAVMYAGQVVEEGPVETLFADPRHPYTRALIACVPRLDGGGGAALASIEGVPPPPGTVIGGCAFAARCPAALERCRAEAPAERRVAGRRVACWVA
jgi:oligopeptide/dipeptide ABC transporter ATP-binding protein